MNIKLIAKDSYKFFINRYFFKDIDLDQKEKVIDFVKDIILQKRKILNLRGFYKVLVYINKKVGIFIEMTKIEDSNYFNNLDLRVIVNNESEIYYETDDYFKIANCKEIRYLDGKFYCLVDDLVDKILEKIEFGRFIYGEELLKVLASSVIL